MSYYIQYLKEYLKYLLQIIHRDQRPIRDPIFIASSRRSGSTLLMEMIYSQNGVAFVDQPLEFWRPNIHKSRVPFPSGKRYTTLGNEEMVRVINFLSEVWTGNKRWRTQYNIFSGSYSFTVDRYAIKCFNIKPFLTELDDYGSIVYLVRNPLTQAASIMDRGWGENSSAFLNDKDYTDQFLTSQEIDFCNSVIQNGGMFKRLILQWCLENLYVLRKIRDKDWLIITYEELTLRPKSISKLLCNKLDFPDTKRMAEQINRPSQTTQNESLSEFAQHGPVHLAKRRFRQLSDSQISAAREVLLELDVDVYSADTPEPARWATHFGSISLSN